MKKVFFIASLAGSLMLFFTNCKTAQKTVSLEKNENTVTVELPFSGKEYRTDKEYFRAVNSGKSPDISTAKKIALSNAKAEIASNISSKIKGITDNYAKQRSDANADDLEKSFETITREVVNQQLVDVTVKDEKILKTGPSYEYWIAIEVSKQSILNGMSNSVSKNQKVQIDYDKMKFEEKLNQEMSKMENDGK